MRESGPREETSILRRESGLEDASRGGNLDLKNEGSVRRKSKPRRQGQLGEGIWTSRTNVRLAS